MADIENPAGGPDTVAQGPEVPESVTRDPPGVTARNSGVPALPGRWTSLMNAPDACLIDDTRAGPVGSWRLGCSVGNMRQNPKQKD